jgi:hypothetical protein
MVLQFYAKEAMADHHLAYYPNSRIDAWPKGGPEWFICHKESFADPAPPGTNMTDLAGNRYEFVKSFQTAPLSGVHWYIFHNQARE